MKELAQIKSLLNSEIKHVVFHMHVRIMYSSIDQTCWRYMMKIVKTNCIRYLVGILNDAVTAKG